MKRYLHIALVFITIQVRAQIGVVNPGTGVLTGLGIDSTLGVQNLAIGNNCVSYCSLISLPLHLLDFWGNKETTVNHLYWKTTNEENVKHYIIQRSANQQFDSIGTVTSLNIPGNHQYDFTDYLPLEGKNFYRLKMVDTDGKYTYSKTVLLNRPVAGKLLLYPNPVNAQFTVELYAISSGLYELGITDMTGRKILNMQKMATRGVNRWQFNAERLPSGKYALDITEEKSGTKIKTAFIVVR